MNRLRFSLCLLLSLALLGVLGVPAQAEEQEAALDLDTVVANHIAAKGGRDAWDAIESLRLTGDFTAYSKIRPFTMHKTRTRKYHLDHVWGNQPVWIGFDGTTAWWDNRFFGKGAREIEGPDRTVLERELDFATPLFDLESAGHTATLLGLQDLEGQEVIAIELVRTDQSKETWYLDSLTYLEVARDSPASDFGRPMVQRTFFDNFREVAGVMIPHYTETQWYTRHRVVDAHSIEANVEIDDALFSMPPPFGMEQLQSLAGSWKIAVESRQNPAGPFSEIASESTVDAHFRGGLLEEQWTAPDGTKAIRSVSFDQFRDRYVATQINSSTNSLDILTGAWDDDGALVLDDLATETPAHMFGMTIYERLRLFDIAADSFKMEIENSIDGGESWAVMQKLAYSRKSDASDAEEDTP